MRWNVGVQIFQCIGEKAVTFLGYTDKGSAFVYGYLVSQTPFDTSVLPHNETYNSTGKVWFEKNFYFCYRTVQVR